MRYILFVFFLFLLRIGFSQEVYQLDTIYPVHSLDYILKVFPDPDNTFTPEQILQDSTLTFLRGDELPKYLEVGTTYWGKLDLITAVPLKGWTLHFEDNRIGLPAWSKSNGKVDVYAFVDGNLIFHKKTGVEYPKKERDVKANWVLNQVGLEGLPLNQEVQIVIRVQGNDLGHPAYFNISARSSNQPYYHRIYQFHNGFNIFMFGVTFIILLYHLLQYIYQKERVFLWFCIWLLFCTLTMAMSIGLIIGSFPKYRFAVWILIANGVFYSFWFFGRVFINSREKFPKLDKFILALALFVLSEIIIMVGYVIIYNPQAYFTGVGVHYSLLQVYTVASLIMSIILVFKKDLFARYFGIGSIIGSGFLILGTLWAMQIIRPSADFFIDPFATGIFLQIIIYSFGIAYRRQKLAEQAQEEKLEAQKSMAEVQRIKDLDELKTRFFTNISHEFRTPLTLIKGPIMEARKKNEKKSDKEEIILTARTFSMIERNTDRLQNLVDELLELSKIESGKMMLSLSEGNVMAFLKSVVYSFESEADRSHIQFIADFSEGRNNDYFDKGKLEKIVYNLVSNAFKYTSEKGSVSFKAFHEGDFLNFEVSDTGKGMAEKDLNQIFDRFYRVEGSEQKGSGIGLALSKELVELHHGKIAVESKIYVGTTFIVKLPVRLQRLPKNVLFTDDVKEKGKPELEKNQEVSIDTLKQNDLQNNESHKVLIVEDNTDLRSFMHEVLSSKFEVLLASDGAEGEYMAVEQIPDVIVSDVMMPKINGFELCHSIKNNPKTSHIPVIILTAKAGQENKMEGLTQGADVYLTKPFDADELRLRVQNLLNNRKRLWEKIKNTQGILVDNLELTSVDDVFFKKITRVIDDYLDDETFSVDVLSKAVGFSRSQLHRKLRSLLNKTPNQLITEIRLNKAHELLRNNACSVSEAAYSVGYSNMSYFTKSFKEKFGIPPSKV